MDAQTYDGLPEYQLEYPSRFRKGTLGWVLDQEAGVEQVTELRKREIESQFHKLETAYKAGRKAGSAGLGKDVNPYKERPVARSFSEHDEWLRGWRDVRLTARQAARALG